MLENTTPLHIQVIHKNLIPGGVEVFARVWQGSTQIGFGQDGSVDIERFKILNPPDLVNDSSSTIKMIRPRQELDGGVVIPEAIRTLRKDPDKALLISLEQIVRAKQHAYIGSNIIVGKIGNTTTTIYPHSSDGYVRHEQDVGFSLARDASVGTAVVTTATSLFTRVYQRTTSQFRLERINLSFDTTSIGSDQTVTGATLSLTPSTLLQSGGTVSDGTIVIWGNQSSNTTLNVADWQPYDSPGVFTPISGKVSYSAQSVGSPTDFVLTDFSRIWTSGTENTKLVVTTDDDQQDTPPSWGSGEKYMYYFYHSTEVSGTVNDPRLVVEHEAGGGGGVVNPALLNLGRL